MKRVFHREATIASVDGSAPIAADQLASARAALASAPDDRGKHRELARALERRGSLDELDQVLTAWQQRDPLDPDAIGMRADLLAARGDRKAAARVLGGVASSDASRLDDLALGAERLGDTTVACSLRVAAAENRPDDLTRVARAIRCERTQGRATAADRWLQEARNAKGSSAIDAALAKLDDAAPVFGDVVVDASWNGGADLDVAVIDPNGQRFGWMAGRGRVVDPTSLAHEKLGISSGSVGTFLVEISRASAGSDPVSGFVSVTAFGMSKRVPFVLSGPSARVARVDARLVSELVPVDAETPTAPFDASAARARVSAISLAGCSVTEGPFGSGSARVTFDPAGFVSDVTVAAPFAGTREGMCVSRVLRSVRVPPFSGARAMVTRSFVIAP